MAHITILTKETTMVNLTVLKNRTLEVKSVKSTLSGLTELNNMTVTGFGVEHTICAVDVRRERGGS
jgi:hypothetical protein